MFAYSNDRKFKLVINIAKKGKLMPLPFILAGAVVALGVGAKKGYDGYQDKKYADDLIEDAKKNYTEEKEQLDDLNDQVSLSLEVLGELELKIGQDLERFEELVKQILTNSDFQKYGDTKINLPQHRLNKIKEVAFSATDYLKTVVGGGVSGAATGFAVYSGVMAFGAASTGTSISALSGVAAYNATMAAIGGGSLAAGGWGMAGGAMVLGGAVVAPILAVAGIAYAIHGSKALDNAWKIRDEVSDTVNKIHQAKEQLTRVDDYASSIYFELDRIYKIFEQYFGPLEKVVNVLKEKKKEQLQEILATAHNQIEEGYALAAIMAEIISMPLFKVKKDENGKAVLSQDGVPEIEIDESGMQVLDQSGLDQGLSKAKTEFKDFKSSL